MTRLGWLNFVVFQWFFVRLGRVRDMDSGEQIGWGWIKGVVPLTGWWSDYRYVPKRERRYPMEFDCPLTQEELKCLFCPEIDESDPPEKS